MVSQQRTFMLPKKNLLKSTTEKPAQAGFRVLVCEFNNEMQHFKTEKQYYNVKN